MILSDSAIFAALDDGRIAIDPEPSPRTPEIGSTARPFNRSSVDLRLGSVLCLPKRGLAVTIDPIAGSPGPTLEALYEERHIPEEGYVLDPSRFILGVTLETIRLRLPRDLDGAIRSKGCLAARVEGKSSLARFGLLVHFTAPTIHAGFEGTIALEMMNLGPAAIRLRPGMAICQLIIEQVFGEPVSGDGQFQGQLDPAGKR